MRASDREAVEVGAPRNLLPARRQFPFANRARPHFLLPVKNRWLVKQEPESYAFAQFVRDRETLWDGVRNFQARNNLRAMKQGDAVLFYESGERKAVVGTATVSGGPAPDPTATDGDWTAVRLRAGRPLARAVSLAEIKATPALAAMMLVRNSRLSVMPLTTAEYDAVLAMSKK